MAARGVVSGVHTNSDVKHNSHSGKHASRNKYVVENIVIPRRGTHILGGIKDRVRSRTDPVVPVFTSH